jgi:XTP/dITP diphosphohydrolase/tetrapyrrole methylase family protein/MazG family protein/ATP diphosphatase
VPHTVEEAYEVADAALAGDDEKLLDELGDLLFQVYFLSLLLEERGKGDLAAALTELQALTERLRRECPWDREQTAETIVPHTVEEAYEVADAALAGNDVKLLDELGDLLFQVYFLALLLEERGAGDLAQAARGIHAKLVRRHPHVFGEVEADTPARVKENWERIKVEQEGRSGIFHDVPEALPGLLYARKVQQRAKAVGFEYPDAAGALADLDDEVAELKADLDEPARRAEELGDVLFAAVNVARKLDVDPELELRRAAQRFRGRVEQAEKLAAAAGEDWAALELADQDRYFDLAKETA